MGRSASLPLFVAWEAPQPLPRKRQRANRHLVEQLRSLQRERGERFNAAVASALSPAQRSAVRAVVTGRREHEVAKSARVVPTAIHTRLVRAHRALVAAIRAGIQQPLPLERAPLQPAARQKVVERPRLLQLVPPLAPSPQPPCSSCPLRSTCRAVCPELERAANLPPAELHSFKEITESELGRGERRFDIENLVVTEPVDAEDVDDEEHGWAEIAQMTRPRLRRAIRSSLTPKQREVVLALIVDQKRQADIARERGVSRETICIMLRRARQRLARALHATAH